MAASRVPLSSLKFMARLPSSECQQNGMTASHSLGSGVPPVDVNAESPAQA